jgi:hypothetical protein
VLSVLLRYTDSDYPFNICKLFLAEILLKMALNTNKTNVRGTRMDNPETLATLDTKDTG